MASENPPAAENTPCQNKKKMASENLPAAEKAPCQKKKKVASENYRFVIKLNNIDKPVITRTLSVPKTITFHKFHQALQIASPGTYSTHLYKFELVEPRPPKRRRWLNGATLMQLEEQPDPIVLSFIEYPLEKSTNVTLQQVLEDPQYAGARMDYTLRFW